MHKFAANRLSRSFGGPQDTWP